MDEPRDTRPAQTCRQCVQITDADEMTENGICWRCEQSNRHDAQEIAATERAIERYREDGRLDRMGYDPTDKYGGGW